jgi:UDP-glucose 4-epimerase
MSDRPLITDETVLVTGGAGFIGSHLVDTLSPRNEVRVLDDLSDGHRDWVAPDAQFIEGDITDRSTLEEAMRGADFVFHLAANASVQRSIDAPRESHQVNVDATLDLLELARQTEPRVVIASSAAIYGPPDSVPISEDDPKRPSSPYGVEKLTVDQYARQYHDHYAVNTVTLRYFNVYGPRHSGGSYSGVIDSFVSRARAGDPLEIHGDGLQTRDFVHVDDIVQANLRAATTDHVGEVFNIGTGKSVTIRELAELVRDVTGSESIIRHTDGRDGDIRHSRADVSKADELLKFRQTVSLEEGLRSLVHSSR